MKSSQEVREKGYFGGRFAEDARFFVGTLANEGHYNMWMTLQAGNQLSDVYFYNFIIPSWDNLFFLINRMCIR